MVATARPRVLGVLGAVIGLMAMVVTVLHFYLGPIKEPPTVESFVAEKAVGIKQAIEARIKGETHRPQVDTQAFDPDLMLQRGSMIAALAAVSLGVFGFLRKEEAMPSGLAVGLGGATVVFSLSIVIAGIIVFAMVIAAIVAALGLDVGV